LLTQLKGCHELYGEYRGVRIGRKHIAWYCSGQRGAAAFRAFINQVESAAEQLGHVERFFFHAEQYEAAA
jgi:tRNA-dihydrouridine synthase B